MAAGFSGSKGGVKTKKVLHNKKYMLIFKKITKYPKSKWFLAIKILFEQNAYVFYILTWKKERF